MTSRFQNGLQLAKQSLVIIKENKKLLIFPIISGILTLIIIYFGLKPSYEVEELTWKTGYVHTKPYLIAFGILLIAFILINLVTLTLDTALIACAMKHIQKENYRLSMGFKIMLKNTWKLYCYKLILTTVIPALQFLEYWYDNWLDTRFANYFLCGLNAMTGITLVLPVIANENCGPIQAIKRSASLIKNTWGINLIPRVGIAGAMAMIYFISLIPLIITILIGGKINIVIGGILTTILFLSTSIMNSATQVVLTSALYLFAIGKDVSSYYQPELLKTAFYPRKQKTPGAS